MEFWDWRDLSEEKYIEMSKDRWILYSNVQNKIPKSNKLFKPYSGKQLAYLEMSTQYCQISYTLKNLFILGIMYRERLSIRMTDSML